MPGSGDDSSGARREGFDLKGFDFNGAFGGMGGPGGGPGGFSGGDFPGGSASASSVTQSDWILLAACAAVLCLGIMFTKKYHVVK